MTNIESSLAALAPWRTSGLSLAQIATFDTIRLKLRAPALRRRHGAWLVLAAGVALLHAVVLGLLTPPPRPDQAASTAGRPLRFQLVPHGAAPAAAGPAVAEVLPEPAVARPAQIGPAVLATVRRPAARPLATAVAVHGVPVVAAAQPGRRIADAVQTAGVVAPVRPAAATDRSGEVADSPAHESTVPRYATALPASVNLHFVLRRGPASGSAELRWQRRGDDYDMLLNGVLQGQPLLDSTSRGSVDADGVAPQRHAERKRSREVRAANFQRDAGLITFSGPDLQLPLPRGAQDRLSWMVQLPAIVEADPQLRVAGAQVTLYVVGSRGDAQAWHFAVQGHETLDLPAGPAADTLRLLREPGRPFDTRAEVWLDPARQHLPVRAVFTTLPGGQPLELQLSRAAFEVP